MKFKVGDYVEITESRKGNKGHRFIITDVFTGTLDGVDNIMSAETDVIDEESLPGEREMLWAAFENLKLVHDDEPGDMSFDELMLDLTQKLTVK